MARKIKSGFKAFMSFWTTSTAVPVSEKEIEARENGGALY